MACAGPILVVWALGLLWLNAWNVAQKDNLSLVDRLRGVDPPRPPWWYADTVFRCRTCGKEVTPTRVRDAVEQRVGDRCPHCGASESPIFR